MKYKIISGGQTGADKGALEAAKEKGVQTGGFAPKGYLTEDGADLTLKDFGLVEMILKSYVARSIANVTNSDGTIAFRLYSSPGTDKTIGYCQTKNWKSGKIQTMNKNETKFKPVCVITDINDEKVVTKIVDFIKNNKISTINVCGHRKSGIKGFDFQKKVKSIIIKVISEL